MFINGHLSRFSANNTETDSIPFLTSTNDVTGNLYINYDISDALYTIEVQPESREDHCFPLTCMQSRPQKITLPGLFSAREGAVNCKSKTPQPVTPHTAASALPSRPANLS